MREAVDNLFKGIEVANMVGTLPDGEEPGEPIEVAPLIDELNQLSDMYSRSISIRVANNKRRNKVDDETDGEDEPIEELIDESETPAEDDTTAPLGDDTSPEVTDVTDGD